MSRARRLIRTLPRLCALGVFVLVPLSIQFVPTHIAYAAPQQAPAAPEPEPQPAPAPSPPDPGPEPKPEPAPGPTPSPGRPSPEPERPSPPEPTPGPTPAACEADGDPSDCDKGTAWGLDSLLDIPGMIVNAVTAFLGMLVEQAMKPLRELLADTLLATPDVTEHADIKRLWTNCMAITACIYVLFVTGGGITVMGYETVQTRYALQQIAPRLLVGIVTAAASLTVMGKAIGLSNALAHAIMATDMADAGQGLVERALPFSLFGGTGIAIYLLLLAVVELVLVLAVLVGFIVRVALMALLAVIAPLALACHAHPVTDPIARLWWRGLAGCLVIQIAQSMTFILALKLFFAPGATTLGIPKADELGTLLAGLALFWALFKIPGWTLQVILRGTPIQQPHAPAPVRMLRHLALYQLMHHYLPARTPGRGPGGGGPRGAGRGQPGGGRGPRGAGGSPGPGRGGPGGGPRPGGGAGGRGRGVPGGPAHPAPGGAGPVSPGRPGPGPAGGGPGGGAGPADSPAGPTPAPARRGTPAPGHRPAGPAPGVPPAPRPAAAPGPVPRPPGGQLPPRHGQRAAPHPRTPQGPRATPHTAPAQRRRPVAHPLPPHQAPAHPVRSSHAGVPPGTRRTARPPVRFPRVLPPAAVSLPVRPAPVPYVRRPLQAGRAAHVRVRPPRPMRLRLPLDAPRR
ncbi:hypothetical protein ACFWZ2_37650 [Streptomyces sp. NPDC059002]|uniref:hypothetical protein n=1 Tax=Streptomyces sp. NPDC059002 TaxID=3346690 RepID=UPI00368EA33B